MVGNLSLDDEGLGLYLDDIGSNYACQNGTQPIDNDKGSNVLTNISLYDIVLDSVDFELDDAVCQDGDDDNCQNDDDAVGHDDYHAGITTDDLDTVTLKAATITLPNSLTCLIGSILLRARLDKWSMMVLPTMILYPRSYK